MTGPAPDPAKSHPGPPATGFRIALTGGQAEALRRSVDTQAVFTLAQQQAEKVRQALETERKRVEEERAARRPVRRFLRWAGLSVLALGALAEGAPPLHTPSGTRSDGAGLHQGQVPSEPTK